MVDAGDGCSSPLCGGSISTLLTSCMSNIKCAFALGRQGAASSLCWRSSPSMGGGDACCCGGSGGQWPSLVEGGDGGLLS